MSGSGVNDDFRSIFNYSCEVSMPNEPIYVIQSFLLTTIDDKINVVTLLLSDYLHIKLHFAIIYLQIIER